MNTKTFFSRNFLFVVLFVFSLFFLPFDAKAEFVDLNSVPTGKSEIMFLHEKGIIRGFPDGTFQPEASITRKQAIIMLGRALNWHSISEQNAFADVRNDDTALPYINEAHTKGIIRGYSDGTFRPNNILTRSQMAAILTRAFNYQSHFEIPYKDVTSDFWAKDVIMAVSSNGIVNGYSNGNYGVGDDTTRRHFSMMLARALEDSYKTELSAVVQVDTTLNVRNQPSLNGDKVGSLVHNEVVKYEPTSDPNWVKVYTNEVVGFSHTDFLVHPKSINLPLIGKSIVLDAGHGGRDGGASYGGLVEKTLNLTITKKTKTLLEEMGAVVHLTRFDDRFIELEDRVALTAQKNVDIFVSIHNNASSKHSFHGTETFYNKTPYENEANPYPNESYSLALQIQNELKQLPTKDLGIKDKGFKVLRLNTVPSALVEVAFLDNPIDATLLKDEQFLQDASVRIAKGIFNYLKTF